MLPPSAHRVTRETERAWANGRAPFRVPISFQRLAACAFNVTKCPREILEREAFFAGSPSSGTASSFTSKPPSSLTALSGLRAAALAARLGLRHGQCQRPHDQLSVPYVHVCLMQISLPTTVSTFFLCCPFFFLFLFLTDFPLTSPPVFVRCREGVLRGCEEATGLPAWPPACDRHPRQARRAQSPTGEEEGRDCRLRSDLWSAELAARSVPSAVAQLASSGCPSLNRGITGLELGN